MAFVPEIPLTAFLQAVSPGLRAEVVKFLAGLGKKPEDITKWEFFSDHPGKGEFTVSLSEEVWHTTTLYAPLQGVSDEPQPANR